MTSQCLTRCGLIRNRREPGKARSPLLTIFPFDSVFAVQETHPADPIFMLCHALQALQL